MIIPGDTLAEGEKDKVIQSVQKPVEQKDEDISTQETEKDKIEPQLTTQSHNSVPFPSTPEPLAESNVEVPLDDDPNHYG